MRRMALYQDAMQNVKDQMEEQKPKSIRTVGLIVSIFAGFIVFSNGMGALAWTAIGMGEDQNMPQTVSTDAISLLLEHYIELCLIMLIIGITYLIGGLFIRKHRLWANKLVTYLSGLLILIIWGLMTAMSISAGQQEGMGVFSIGAILTALFWSIPIGLLIWFLNRQRIKKHFA